MRTCDGLTLGILIALLTACGDDSAGADGSSSSGTTGDTTGPTGGPNSSATGVDASSGATSGETTSAGSGDTTSTGPGDTTSTGTGDPETVARVRTMHLAVGAGELDVFVDEDLPPWVSALGFREGAGYDPFDPGELTLLWSPTGQDPAEAVVSGGPFPLEASTAHTIVALGDAAMQGLELLALEDDDAGLDATQIRLQLVHAAPALGTIDLLDLTPSSPGLWLDDATLSTAGVVDIAPSFRALGLDTDLDGEADLTYDVPLAPARPGSLLDVFITSDDADPAGVALAVLQPDGTVDVIEPNEAAGCRFFVDGTNGDDAAHGKSWPNAKRTLQAALAQTSPIESPELGPCEVWVAEGTYTPGAGRSSTFTLWNEISLYGGFGGDEDDVEQRDPLAHPTVLSGDIGVPGDATDNSYHVVTSYLDARLDSVEVRGGNSNGLTPVAERHGAGIDALGMLTLANAIVADNTTGDGLDGEIGSAGGPGGCGAGLYAAGGSVRVENSRFENNRTGDGGSGSQGGHGGDGGALCSDVFTYDVQIIDSVFVGNHTGAGGDGESFGGFGGNGAGVYLEGALDPVVIQGSRFEGNTNGAGSPTGSSLQGARGWAGGLFYGSGGSGSLLLADSEFVANEGRFAGGMHLGTSNSSGSTVVMNTLVHGNVADGTGGGIRISLNGATPVLIANTVIANNVSGGTAGGLRYNPPVQSQGKATVQMVNSIIWGNTAPEDPQVAAPRGSFTQPRIDLIEVDLQSGCVDTSVHLFTCTSVLDTDPLFVDAIAGDLHLQAGSPLVDAGSGALLPDDVLDLDGDLATVGDPWPFDLEGAARVVGDEVDLGPYETP